MVIFDQKQSFLNKLIIIIGKDLYTRECGEGDCGGGGTRECRLELWPGQLNSNMGVAVYNVSHVLMLVPPLQYAR